MDRPKKVGTVVMAAQPSETVTRSLEAGWTQACDGLAALSWCRFRYREHDHGPYRLLDVHVGERRIQVSISPTGRSVRVFVDGTEA